MSKRDMDCSLRVFRKAVRAYWQGVQQACSNLYLIILVGYPFLPVVGIVVVWLTVGVFSFPVCDPAAGPDGSGSAEPIASTTTAPTAKSTEASNDANSWSVWIAAGLFLGVIALHCWLILGSGVSTPDIELPLVQQVFDGVQIPDFPQYEEGQLQRQLEVVQQKRQDLVTTNAALVEQLKITREHVEFHNQKRVMLELARSWNTARLVEYFEYNSKILAQLEKLRTQEIQYLEFQVRTELIMRHLEEVAQIDPKARFAIRWFLSYLRPDR